MACKSSDYILYKGILRCQCSRYQELAVISTLVLLVVLGNNLGNEEIKSGFLLEKLRLKCYQILLVEKYLPCIFPILHQKNTGLPTVFINDIAVLKSRYTERNR